MNISPTTSDHAGELLYDDSNDPRLFRPSVPYNAPGKDGSFVLSVANKSTATPPLSDSRAYHEKSDDEGVSGGRLTRQT